MCHILQSFTCEQEAVVLGYQNRTVYIKAISTLRLLQKLKTGLNIRPRQRKTRPVRKHRPCQKFQALYTIHTQFSLIFKLLNPIKWSSQLQSKGSGNSAKKSDGGAEEGSSGTGLAALGAGGGGGGGTRGRSRGTGASGRAAAAGLAGAGSSGLGTAAVCGRVGGATVLVVVVEVGDALVLAGGVVGDVSLGAVTLVTLGDTLDGLVGLVVAGVGDLLVDC